MGCVASWRATGSAPVRLAIHSSEVSTTASSSTLLTRVSGEAAPAPMIRAFSLPRLLLFSASAVRCELLPLVEDCEIRGAEAVKADNGDCGCCSRVDRSHEGGDEREDDAVDAHKRRREDEGRREAGREGNRLAGRSGCCGGRGGRKDAGDGSNDCSRKGV